MDDTGGMNVTEVTATCFFEQCNQFGQDCGATEPKELDLAELTDLEGAALAEVARRGVATSYAISRAFADSPSEFWSGSAGAVYPMLRRLTERGLLAADMGARGRRAHIGYSLNAAGHAALKAWLLDPKRGSGLGFDPLRTRAVHLHLASADEVDTFLAQIRVAMQEQSTHIAWQDDERLSAIHEAVLQNRRDLLQRLTKVLKKFST